MAILGGSKVSSKIGVINNLLEIADTIIIGGGMAYTFSAAQGGRIGDSLLESDWTEYARDMVKKAADKGVKLLLPVDTVMRRPLCPGCRHPGGPRRRDSRRLAGPGHRPGDREALYREAVADAGTVIWNGPMGVFEFPDLRRRAPRLWPRP